MSNISFLLGGEYSPVPFTPEEQLRQAMTLNGIVPPRDIYMDGKLHRFTVDGSHDAGWYVAYGDSPQAGVYGNWKTGEQANWRVDSNTEESLTEKIAYTRRMTELRDIRDKELREKQESAASTVTKIWEMAGLASDDHPYLKRKGVKAHGLRITGDGRLIAPLYNKDGTLSSLQYIGVDGGKQYHAGGAVKACSYTLGSIESSIYIVEGFATGATVYELTKKPVVIAYSAGNLLNVTEYLRNIYPSLSITIIADNDESGVGQAKAEQAAAKYGATVIVSPVNSDVNDYVQGGGDLISLLEGVKDRFTEALITPNNLHDEFVKTLTLSWVIKDIIPESSGLTMIYGSPGTYKSFVAVDMALSIANGIDWHGKRTKQHSVLYIAAEGQFGILKRFEVWRKYHEIDKLENIAILPMAAKLDNISDLTALMNLIRNIYPVPGFIFFDTLARSMDGEENDKVGMGVVINAIDMLRHEFGIQAVIIHHSGKDVTRGARGSNSLEGATDTQFKMEKGKEVYTAIMTCERQKDDEAVDPIGFVMKKVDTGFKNIDGDTVDSLVSTVDYDVVPKQKDGKKQETKDLELFEKAWLKCGEEVVESYPFLTRSLWSNWLFESKISKTENAANSAVKASGKGLANRLIDGGKIVEHGGGYLLTDSAFSSRLLLSRNGRNG